MEDAVIVDAVRTPVGRYGGALKSVRPDDLAALVIKTVVGRNRFDPAEVEDVILGCTNGAGEDNRNVARMALLLAGLPQTAGGLTVNRLCGSGLDAVNRCAQSVMAGMGEVFIGGGVESMTRSPFVMLKPEGAYPRGALQLVDTTIGWRFNNPRLDALHYPYSMGETAENVAEKYGVSREDQDRFALESQRRAARAQEEGLFAEEIAPVETPGRKRGESVLVERAGVREAEALIQASGSVVVRVHRQVDAPARGMALVEQGDKGVECGRAVAAALLATVDQEMHEQVAVGAAGLVG